MRQMEIMGYLFVVICRTSSEMKVEDNDISWRHLNVAQRGITETNSYVHQCLCPV